MNLFRRVKIIIVTGALGFIGSNIISALNSKGIKDIIAVDNLDLSYKFHNLSRAEISEYIDNNKFRQILHKNKIINCNAIFHQGACTNTIESNGSYMMDNNYNFTLELFKYCQNKKIPLIYASSASVYGNSYNYKENIENEIPINIYGYSKFLFDKFLYKNITNLNSQVVGLRYFNVYGNNEYHKGKMASIAFHNIKRYKSKGYINLFSGYHGYDNGDQKRDFIYVEDIVNINLHFLENPQISGIYNCGTGIAETFNDMSAIIINNIRLKEHKKELKVSNMIKKKNYKIY